MWDDGRGMPRDRKAGTGLALIEGFVRQIGGTAAWEVEGGTRLTVEFGGFHPTNAEVSSPPLQW